MKQQTLAMASGFEQYARKTRRALFLEEMEQVVPWTQLDGDPLKDIPTVRRVVFLMKGGVAYKDAPRNRSVVKSD